MKTDVAPVIRLRDYQAPDFLVDTVDMDFALHPTETIVRATLAMRRNPDGFEGTPVVLDGDELELVSLAINDMRLPDEAFTVAPDKVVIPHPPEGAFRLTVTTRLNPSANTKLMGLYRTNGVYCTQCEAEGFRRITYFPDRPDVMATYRVRIEADATEAPILLSNGNPHEVGQVPGTNRHYAVWDDPFRKPSYLFALVAGDLTFVSDSFTTMSGRTVDLNIFVEHGKQERAHYAMDALKRSMRWDEEAFGREYDLDVFSVVAVSDFNMGAMENKGLNVFNDRYVLASQETATDQDYHNIEAVIGHEYFHNWTGNRITCRDWFQLCLKEGLTVFRDQEFSSDMRSRPVERIGAVRTLRSAQFVEDAGPLAHPVRPQEYREISNFYTATVYNKGAEVVRMLKTLIGPQAFRRGMDLYFAREDGHAATVEDFIACFAEASGQDRGQFMRWYTQAGTPVVKVVQHYDAAQQTLKLDFEQIVPPTPGQPTKEPAVIPVLMGLIGEDGTELQPSQVLVLQSWRATKTFTGVTQRPVPSLLRSFSAPVRLQTDLADADLLVLAQHDTDAFNRWEALQTYSTRLLTRSVRAIRSGQAAETDPNLSDAIRAVLARAYADPAFAALAVALPGDADIAREIGEDVDPDAIGQAVDALMASVGRGAHDDAQDAYRAMSRPTPFSADAASAGRRSLRAAALSLIAWANREEGSRLAMRQFTEASTMTDRINALAVLNRIGGTDRETAFDLFETRFGADPLILDSWFTLNATSRTDDALDRVRKLTQHPQFSIRNPNRVRALIGAFAQSNMRQFHRADGEGYRFVAGFIRELDPINPQVASRLSTAFRTYRTFEPGRQAHARAALESIRSGSVSKDVADIVDRALSG